MLYKSTRCYLLLFIILIIVGCTSNAQTDNIETLYFPENISKNSINIYNQIDSLISAKAKRVGFNGNVLVNINNEAVYKKSIGFAEFRPKKKLKSESIFQLASISKQFTAMAVMILKEKKLLSYDDDVSKYIKEFPYEGITIRMLLNHTSGMPNYMFLTENNWTSEKIPYNNDVVNLIIKHKPHLYFNSGTKFNYSNTGYVLLAYIVEKVSGKLFSDFMDKNIFKPLKMTNSFIYSRSYEKDYKDRVKGYFKWHGKNSLNLETINDGIVGDKGVYTSGEDLYKWDKSLDSCTLVSKETLDEAFTRLTLKNGNQWHYGFGFRLKEEGNEKIIYHYGRWNSFKNCFMKLPKYKSTIIVLNNTNRNIKWLVDDIHDIIKQNQ
ncbi:MAG: beta-lactamase family protein [Melioribacteraceae bacterium]|nr:beta-lactamase family protein [Melioribacteraceae bacterium]